MIKVNGYPVNFETFPEGEFRMNKFKDIFAHNKQDKISIEWFWNGDNSEMMELYFVVKHLKKIKGAGTWFALYMPYVPYGRQDRVEDSVNEIFTLKHFADFINSLEFDMVQVLDPHSDVTMALIDNSTDDKALIVNIINGLIEDNEYDALFMPDLGAQKRYSSLLAYPNFSGYKVRDYATGEITGYKILDYKKDYKNILIIDDLCSYGGTFLRAAKELKKKGVSNIDMYVTHCETNIYKGDLLYSGLINQIYTTNSIMPMQSIVCKGGQKSVTLIQKCAISYFEA